MKVFTKILLTTTLLLASGSFVVAQGPPPPPPNPAAVPIDGGLGLLLAAGAGLGTRKALQSKKENEKKLQS